MNAAEQLTAFASKVYAELPAIREQYRTLALASRLIARHGATGFEDAVHMEAVARVKRNQWADVTSRKAG